MCPPTTKHNDPNHLKNTTGNNKEKEEEDELQTTIRGTNINDVAIEKPVPFTKLIGLAYPERYMLFFALLCMIVAEGLALVNPLVIANAYDALVNPNWTNAQRMSQINHTMIYVLVIHTTAIVLSIHPVVHHGDGRSPDCRTDTESIVPIDCTTRNCLF